MTFSLVATKAFTFKGRDYEPGQRFSAGLGDAYKLIGRRQARKVHGTEAVAVPEIEAATESYYRKHERPSGVHLRSPEVPAKRRGRPRKVEPEPTATSGAQETEAARTELERRAEAEPVISFEASTSPAWNSE